MQESNNNWNNEDLEKMDDSNKDAKTIEMFKRRRKLNRMQMDFELKMDLMKWAVVLLILAVLVSGFVNQREAGETIIETGTKIGQKIGDFFVDVISGEKFKITKDGVYINKED